MHHLDLSRWQHQHRFTPDRSTAETSTRRVMYLCMVVMLVDIVAGSCFNSMAVVADGFHLGTQLTAFLITALAYRLARRRAEDPWFSFGTGKVGVLGGFTRAIILGFVALLIAYECILDLFRSEPIHFKEAMAVATLGLAVNIASALLLREDDDHGHHRHKAKHENPGLPGGHRHEQVHDLNFRAAYVHVLTDAAISVLAIQGLGAGKLLGWIWLNAGRPGGRCRRGAMGIRSGPVNGRVIAGPDAADQFTG